MSKITPFLWFDNNGEEAMNFYVSTFKNSRVLKVARFGKKEDVPGGEVWIGTFVLDGQEFCALNGGPHYKICPGVSFYVKCETQAEVDDLWSKLAAGGKPQGCGWLEDKFGVTWQIIPTVLTAMLQDKDLAKAGRVRLAMLKMMKIDIPALEAAYAGK